MKKYLIISNVILVALIFNACSFGGDDFEDTLPLISRTGVLTEQEFSDKEPGTHVLNVAASEKTYLRSVSLNLSDNQYLANKVTVVGVMNDDDKVLEVTGVSVLEVLVKREENPLLLPYKNTDLGLEIQYYSNWELKEWQNGDVEFKNAESGQAFKIARSPFNYVPEVNEDSATDTPLEAFFREKFPNQTFPGVNKIGKDELLSFKMENDDYVNYYLYRNGLIYEVSMLKVPGQSDLAYNEMIGSFRFVGFTAESVKDADSDALAPLETDDDASGSDVEFTSFASLPYFFTANYPADWYYSGISNYGDANVKHHYGFSNETLSDTNELIAMDVIVEVPEGGQKIDLEERSATKFVTADKVSIFMEIDGQKYNVSGLKEYESIIISMAKSIKPVAE
ncbi:hypothetical protein HY604_00330 [Candidatus Peregrinibacteria bacterium]|nr:hypothetical protein [Candidatus Peregrinibacteria bacterium]